MGQIGKCLRRENTQLVYDHKAMNRREVLFVDFQSNGWHQGL